MLDDISGIAVFLDTYSVVGVVCVNVCGVALYVEVT
jgi:hypothetical protein